MANTASKQPPIRPQDYPAGVIGLGLMGHSIIACLLAAGHTVTAVSRSLKRHPGTRRHILSLLRQMRREGLLRAQPERLMERLRLSEDFRDLSVCRIVIESIVEDMETKKEMYQRLEESIPRDVIIGSNTSAIPVSLLQEGARHPERFVGIHWDEPAHITRFMEIILGEKSKKSCGRVVMALAEAWGKEPSLLKKDIRGFITNRVSYAMFREACYLVDSGVCTMEDVDRSLRNDVGWWMPFAGPFRYMDLMGAHLYGKVMKDLLPELCASPEVPPLMQRLLESGGRGISNGRGFYRYTPEQARQWEKLFTQFNYEVRRLALKYPSDCGNRPKQRGARSVRGRSAKV
jgi:3-hydroxybutyryl-CoA dehydrogenase